MLLPLAQNKEAKAGQLTSWTMSHENLAVRLLENTQKSSSFSPRSDSRLTGRHLLLQSKKQNVISGAQQTQNKRGREREREQKQQAHIP